MLKSLIYIGLSITPFIIIGGMDSRQPKEIFALWLAAAISFLFIFKGGKIRCPNKYIILFIAWVIAITPFVPKWVGLNLNGGGNVDGLWTYKAITHLIVYFMAYIAIINMPINNRMIDTSLKIIMYVGFLMAILGLLQFINIDMFFKKSLVESTEHVKSFKITGTLGHPTIFSQFILLCIPAAIYFRKWIAFLTMLFVVIISKSDVSYLAMICGIFFYLSFGSINRLIISSTVIFSISSILYLTGIISLSGRLDIWILALKDMFNNPYTFFSGFGFGSWSYIFQPLMHSNLPYWSSAHNEYLELLWGCGIIGLAIFVKIVLSIFSSAWNIKDMNIKVLLTMLVIVLICSSGNFIFHLGVFNFYTLIIVGIISNQVNKKEQLSCTA